MPFEILLSGEGRGMFWHRRGVDWRPLRFVKSVPLELASVTLFNSMALVDGTLTVHVLEASGLEIMGSLLILALLARSNVNTG